MFCCKSFKEGKDRVVAICDSGLLGKDISEKDLCIKVSESFYGSKKVDEETALLIMKECTIGNIIGKNIVELAKRHGFITEENVISIGGIPHAQFVK
jgi:hypothetical protein